MKKIISLFARNYGGDRLVRDEILPGAEWVIDGEGVATRKWDGTCCMVRGGRLFKRHDVKNGRTAPDGFEPAQDPDEITGHWPGWLPVGDGPEDAYHREAFKGTEPDGTYELVGPKVNSNPDKFEAHTLVPHGQDIVDAPRSYNELKEWLRTADIEGVVWHNQDGRMVKIKAKDFGWKRGRA